MPKTSERGIAQIIVLMLLIAGLGAGSYLVQQKQILNPKAFDNGLVSVNSCDINLTNDQEISGSSVSTTVVGTRTNPEYNLSLWLLGSKMGDSRLVSIPFDVQQVAWNSQAFYNDGDATLECRIDNGNGLVIFSKQVTVKVHNNLVDIGTPPTGNIVDIGTAPTVPPQTNEAPSLNSIDIGTAPTYPTNNGSNGLISSGSDSSSGTEGGFSSRWVFCANENETCQFSGIKPVKYGANSVFVTKMANQSIDCNNGVFGDPIPGTFKYCYYLSDPQLPSVPMPSVPLMPPPPYPINILPVPVSPTTPVCQPFKRYCPYFNSCLWDFQNCPTPFSPPPPNPLIPYPQSASPSAVNLNWVFCAREGGTCEVKYPNTTVRYGENGTYKIREVTGSVECNNGVFGDPLEQVFKHCDYLSQ